MRSADIEFKAGNVRTADPVSVKFTGGTIDADSLEMYDNGQKVVFSGRVKTVMRMAAEPKPAKAPAAVALPVKDPSP